MADGLQPEMQGSPNPLILRNYRMIPPQTFKYFNLSKYPNAYQGQHLPDREIPLIFKVEAAPVVLPYESELVMKFTFLSPKTERTSAISNQWTGRPLYRIKGKSMAHIVKRCWATISNMTFQSYKPPFYLNEILLRKAAPLQMKYPDNYTGEKSIYLATVANPQNNQIRDPYLSSPTPGGQYAMYLEPLSRTVPNEGQLYFMTPQFNYKTRVLGEGLQLTRYTETTLTFRIPLTELLPVFKIGVIPLIMIASNSFDLWIDLYKPSDWFIDCGIGKVAALETYLNITTVSFPDINPLAESLIRPRIYDSRFIAPFLDYLTFENTYNLSQPETNFFFNIIQFLRNVPFISITFSDLTVYNTTSYEAYDIIQNADDAHISGDVGNRNVVITAAGSRLLTGMPDLFPISGEEASKGGFFNLPPNVHCKDLNIMLGESAFPLTQVPMSWDDMYMYNRKHFEMYGRDFNIYRVSPVGRPYSGDASFFFDLSHSPMTGFQIGPSSPLQIVGKIVNEDGNPGSNHTIRVTVTCYYSNNFNTMLASGGVVPLQ